MQARCHVKGISYLSCPETVILLVDNALKPFMPDQMPIWAKAELIGCSGLLRGCAGTSVSQIPQREREKVVGVWVEGIEKFLHWDSCQCLGGDYALRSMQRY